MTFDEIKELIEVMDNCSLASLKIKNEQFSINLNKNSTGVSVAQVAAPVAAPQAAVHAAPVEVSAPAATIEGEVITSPMVGTFYQSPSPDSPNFVKVGDVVQAGQTLAIIEAMKIMNELEAEFACKIVEILAKDGQVIEYDTPIFKIEKV